MYDMDRTGAEERLPNGREAEFPKRRGKHALIPGSADRLANVFPSPLRDTTRLMADWGAEGTINPFDELNEIVFQLTVRMGSCHELANVRKAITHMAQLFDDVEKNSTPISLLLPWFPGPAKRTKQHAIHKLFTLIGSCVEKRRAASVVRTSDTIDHLLGAGCSPESIIQNEPLHEHLASIPLDVWETEIPVTDSVIRETQGITMGASALRRNLGEEVVVGDKPSKFDPRRFDAGREEDKRAPIAFLGWGAGWHMCAGMRIAKLEVKLIMTLFFLTFEFELVDSAGEFPQAQFEMIRAISSSRGKIFSAMRLSRASTSNRKIVIPVKSIARELNVGQFFFWTEDLVGIPCCEIGGEAGTLFTSSGLSTSDNNT
ncbi:cytochrome P450 [Mycena epipterygia]|nr:cytochrome P450 [Mycena epipterygia]